MGLVTHRRPPFDGPAPGSLRGHPAPVTSGRYLCFEFCRIDCLDAGLGPFPMSMWVIWMVYCSVISNALAGCCIVSPPCTRGKYTYTRIHPIHIYEWRKQNGLGWL
ncbi:hypothetical protein BO78DRAFT_226993 [Aspergillus sclerotiicarbonarius CBS 121057]|uniref:Uncharacterized protein n=1 Tax=Aspergillus sclerotiicarbonarius (strain CBS 121057 / IBT 28362) TaxID=1448318 RepID=A0A319DY07_ASPSB|nr:hypothetical protein BO78DRAFT_226993 [Aspergillus sclerotiicarbonarius CBS 121057]